MRRISKAVVITAIAVAAAIWTGLVGVAVAQMPGPPTENPNCKLLRDWGAGPNEIVVTITAPPNEECVLTFPPGGSFDHSAGDTGACGTADINAQFFRFRPVAGQTPCTNIWYVEITYGDPLPPGMPNAGDWMFQINVAAQ